MASLKTLLPWCGEGGQGGGRGDGTGAQVWSSKVRTVWGSEARAWGRVGGEGR